MIFPLSEKCFLLFWSMIGLAYLEKGWFRQWKHFKHETWQQPVSYRTLQMVNQGLSVVLAIITVLHIASNVQNLHANDLPFSGFTPMIETPVKTSLGSQKRCNLNFLLKVGFMIIVHLVVASYSPVCFMSCSWNSGAKIVLSMPMLNMYPEDNQRLKSFGGI